MSQYFVAVNKDKQEYICPWCIGHGPELLEWAINPQGAIFTLLLLKRGDSGGCCPCGCSDPVHCVHASIIGRWAGDYVALVGNYEGSEIWNQVYRAEEPRYRNISQEMVASWNDFIKLDSMMMEYHLCNSCSEAEQE